MTFKAFDVVAVPFPFTDRDAIKRRPALVTSNERFNHLKLFTLDQLKSVSSGRVRRAHHGACDAPYKTYQVVTKY